MTQPSSDPRGLPAARSDRLIACQRRAGHLWTGLVENAALSAYAHQPAAADLVIDVAEHRRRTATTQVVLADPGTLDQLLNFPHGIEIAWPALSPRETSLVQAAAVDAFTCTTAGVTRVFRPVAAVTQVVVRRAVEDYGCVDTAAAFVPYAPTILHLTRPPTDLADYVYEARYHGVGVQIGPLHTPRLLLPPAPLRLHRRVTGQRWAFAERAYAAWLNTATDPTQAKAADAEAADRVIGGDR